MSTRHRLSVGVLLLIVGGWFTTQSGTDKGAALGVILIVFAAYHFVVAAVAQGVKNGRSD